MNQKLRCCKLTINSMLKHIRNDLVDGTITIAIIGLFLTIILTGCKSKIIQNEPITQNPGIPVETQETAGQAGSDDRSSPTIEANLELKREYFELMKDLDYMRFFSNFSAPDEIPEDELVVFGFSKAAEDGKTFSVDGYSGVKAVDIIPYIEKYFKRIIIGKKDTKLFKYDEKAEQYIATGWSFDGAPLHYLTELKQNDDGSLTAIFDVYYFGESDFENIPEDYYISDTTSIPSHIAHAKAQGTFYRREQNGRAFIQMISYKKLNDENS